MQVGMANHNLGEKSEKNANFVAKCWIDIYLLIFKSETFISNYCQSYS